MQSKLSCDIKSSRERKDIRNNHVREKHILRGYEEECLKSALKLEKELDENIESSASTTN